MRCTRGEPVCVAGTVKAVVLRPRAGVPTLEAEVYDGTGNSGNLGQVIAQPVPSHGFDDSATVTIPPLGAVWLRFEPAELTEEQAEPAQVKAGARAAAKRVTPRPAKKR